MGTDVQFPGQSTGKKNSFSRRDAGTLRTKKMKIMCFSASRVSAGENESVESKFENRLLP